MDTGYRIQEWGCEKKKKKKKKNSTGLNRGEVGCCLLYEMDGWMA